MEIIFLLLDIIGIIGGFLAIKEWSFRNKGDGKQLEYILSNVVTIKKSKWKDLLFKTVHSKYEYTIYKGGNTCPRSGIYFNSEDGNVRETFKVGKLFKDGKWRWDQGGEMSKFPDKM